MKLVYELNPPKIVREDTFSLERLREDLQVMVDRAERVANHVDGIHLTDSVLGIPRVSSTTAAGFVKQESGSTKLSVSLRSRDRNFAALCQAVSDAILAGVDSALIILGDEPANAAGDSGLKPSAALRMLKSEGYDSRIKLDLSFPAKLGDMNSPSVQRKVAARPHSLVTQSISSLSELGEIVDFAKGHNIKVAACIMVPAEGNRQSASILGLDWSEYEKNPLDFVRDAAKIADRILLTSPNSFSSGMDLLRQLGR